MRTDKFNGTDQGPLLAGVVGVGQEPGESRAPGETWGSLRCTRDNHMDKRVSVKRWKIQVEWYSLWPFSSVL